MYIYYAVSHACDFLAFAFYPSRPYSSAYSYPLKVRRHYFEPLQRVEAMLWFSNNARVPHYYTYHTAMYVHTLTQ